MFRKRLKKSTREQEEQFGRMFEEEHVGCKDKLAMLISAYFVIVTPILLILIGMCMVALWIFGLL